MSDHLKKISVTLFRLPQINNGCAIVSLPLVIFCILSAPAFAATPAPEVIFNEALKYADANELKKSEHAFLKVIKSSPGHYPSYFNLSVITLQHGNSKKAAEYLDGALKYNPYDLRLNSMLSDVLIERNDLEGAKKLVSSILEKDPANIAAHKRSGIIALKENDFPAALSDFTTLRNLAPSDPDSILLLSLSYALNNDFPDAHEKLQAIHKISPGGNFPSVEKLQSYDQWLITKRSVAPSNPLQQPPLQNERQLPEDLLFSLIKSILQTSITQLSLEREFKNPAISEQIAQRQQTENKYAPRDLPPSSSTKHTRPFDIQGTLTNTVEHYERSPKTSSPINGTNVTTNLALEGKATKNSTFKAELEGFYNRWDNTHVDFFKLNLAKNQDFEVDAGNFSAKYFPTLVSHPTVLEGVRVWKNWSPPAFVPAAVPELPVDIDQPVNLGEQYRKYRIDERQFRNLEFTAVSGRTLRQINVDDRKEQNENTYETSGQFEQFTQAFRLHSRINNVLELGASAAFTKDTINNTAVADTTNPVKSSAVGIDGGINLLDNNLKLTGEYAYGDYDEDTRDPIAKSLSDPAWLFKTEYIAIDSITLAYEQKKISRNFKVEGASQTQDKVTHTIDAVYRARDPKTWSIQTQTFQYMPEIDNEDGYGENKKRYLTFESITDCKLPDDAKFTFDYKYYKEKAKCGCTDYTTLTFTNGFEWTIKSLDTAVKPSYTLERKDDITVSPTDEKRKEYIIAIENTSLKDLKLTYSFERERKYYDGVTTKSYAQNTQNLEALYTLIPSRIDLKSKYSKDLTDPSDTNKTDITTISFELNYASRSGDDKVTLKFERKNNIYLPWSDSSAYKQNYWDLKYTRSF